MKKLLRFLLVFTLVAISAAQESPRREGGSDTAAQPSQRIYKVDFLIYELEGGKKVNERAYSLPVMTIDGKPRSSNFKVGDRVPIHTGTDTYQYLDVGLIIDCTIAEQANKFVVTSDVDLSTIAVPEASDVPAGDRLGPVVRQIKQHFTTIVSPGKPTLATSIDDVNSKKRLQVEVTATRLE